MRILQFIRETKVNDGQAARRFYIVDSRGKVTIVTERKIRGKPEGFRVAE